MFSQTFITSALAALHVFPIVTAIPQLLYTSPLIESRDTNSSDVDYEDLSFIQKWAAIGDSYAAGIGAGSSIENSGDCARYNNSYPYLINTYDTMSGTQTFEFLACSGATTPEVVSNQVSELTDSYDLITVSSGGNDVGLVNILNKCVYQWASVSAEACDDQLSYSASLISDTLPGNLDKLTASLKGKFSSSGKTYITGYAKFFANTSTACDSVTWAFWWQYGARQYLTQARRTKMNELVESANQAISDAATRAGDEFVYVDYDTYFSLTEGRFCEDNVTEPDGDRDGLLFYEWDTDNTNLLKRDVDKGMTEIEARTASRPEIEIRQSNSSGNSSNSGSFGDEITSLIDQTYSTNSSIQQALSDESGPDTTCRGRCLISDDIKRVFHPQVRGHAIIARAVIWHIALSRSGVSGDGSVNSNWGPEFNEAPTSCAKADTSEACPEINGCACYDASGNAVDSVTTSCCSLIDGVAGDANSTSTLQVCWGATRANCTDDTSNFDSCCVNQAAGNKICMFS